MNRIQFFILLGIVGFGAYTNWGIVDCAMITAGVWLLSPHGPKIL